MSKKFLTTHLSLTVTGLLLAGCGGSSGEQQAPGEKPSAEQPKAGDTKAEEPAGKEEPANDSSALEGEILSTGPNGEKATPATTLSLTDEEIEKVKSGDYTAAIVLHYAGNDWSTAQVQGLKDTFEKLGITVLSVTDAQFKAEKQVSDIENVLALDPSIIVSIPVDPVSTAPAYKKAAEEGVKLVFMDNCPNGLEAGKDYVSVVSADNYGNGVAAANIMAEELDSKGKIYQSVQVLV